MNTGGKLVESSKLALLEAEAQGLLGSTAQPLFSADPLGDKSRKCRARHRNR